MYLRDLLENGNFTIYYVHILRPMKKIAIILGTRPEIIKLAPIIRECQRRSLPFVIIHSGQHYDENLDKIFFEELELPMPNYNLNVGLLMEKH